MGVIIISTIINIKKDWIFLDPVISIIFTFIILIFSYPTTKEIIELFMDSTPKGFDVEKFLAQLKKI